MPDSYSHAVTASMILPTGRRLPIPAWMAYRTEDCLAVRMTFGLGGPQDASWVFAWELLAQALDGPVGLGDVRIAPAAGTPGRLMLRLGPPGADACVELRTADVARFVARVRSRSHVDARRVHDALDAELSRISQRT